MIRWTAVTLASLSWVFAFHHHVAENRIGQWACIAAGLVLGAIGLRRWAGQRSVAPGIGLLAAPLLVAAALAGPAYRPALLVLIIGVAVLSLCPRAGVIAPLQSAGFSLTLIGTVLVVQCVTYFACLGWTARNPEVPGLGALLYALLSWLGADVSYSGGVLYVRMMRAVHAFPLQWEHLALFPLLQLWLGGALVAGWNRSRWRLSGSLAVLTATLVGYAILRLFLLVPIFLTCMLYVDHESDVVHVELFWMPWITVLSFLPLIPFLARLLPWSPQAPGLTVASVPSRLTGRERGVLAAAGLAALGLVIGLQFHDPGTPKPGRILLDEAHSRWERTDNAYDTDWYGHESGYNYYCMAQYLRHFYALDFNMDGALTPDKLSAYDVLILKTPTEPYAPQEVDAIEAFVRAGGGLFVLGEHTNVFGSSVFLNEVTRRFGLAFRYDAVFDITRKWEQVKLPDDGRRNRLVSARLAGHPVMAHVPFFRFAVSCSIESDSWKARPVIRSTGLWALPIEYAAANFYPHVEDTTYARFGAFDQAVSVAADRGRVLAFGDSTVYSNFLAFYPGKPEFLLGSVEWLNRGNRLGWVNGLGYATALLGAAIALWLSRRRRPDLGFTVTVVASLSATAWLALWATAAAAERAYPLPEAHTPPTQVVFEMDHSSYELPVFAFTQNYPDSYEILYQWVLRLGYYTTITFDLDSALDGTDPIVIIQPDRPFPPETVAKARAFVERGGSLLVLDAADNGDSTANQLLRPFDLAFGAEPTSGPAIVDPDTGTRICGLFSGRPVEGGQPVLASSDGTVIAAWAARGSGQVIAAGLADRFSDVRMGGSSRSIPDREMRSAYELAFAMLRGLAGKDLPGQTKKLVDTLSP